MADENKKLEKILEEKWRLERKGRKREEIEWGKKEKRGKRGKPRELLKRNNAYQNKRLEKIKWKIKVREKILKKRKEHIMKREENNWYAWSRENNGEKIER